jgi:Ribosomal protein L16/L10E
MKQQPSRLKFKKYHKICKSRLQLADQRLFLPKFGFLGLKALEATKLTFNQIEAGRKTIRRITKKEGFI